MECRPIGVVVNGVHEPVDSGWGSIVSELRVHPEWAPGLAGLESFSHVVVVYLMHEARSSTPLRREKSRSG